MNVLNPKFEKRIRILYFILDIVLRFRMKSILISLNMRTIS